jgi:zinc protease
MKKSCLILAGVLALASSALAAVPYTRVVLPNGLVVIAVEDRSSAVAAFHLGIRYDPSDIPASHGGLAAVSQQLHQNELRGLLKEEPWRELGEQTRGTQAALLLNTELDYCELRGKVSNEMLPQALQLASRVEFNAPEITDEQLQQVREVMLAAQQDAAERLVELTFQRFARSLYGPQSPFIRPVIGTAETVAAVSAGDVSSFRMTYMGTNNAVLTIIGPRSAADLIALARLTLGDCKPAHTTVKFAPLPLPTRSRVSVAQQQGWRGVSLMVGVPAPRFGTPDFVKAQLIYTLLEGDGGRLSKSDVLRSGVGVNRIATREDQPSPVTILPPMATPQPFLVMHLVVAPRQMEEAREELLKQFETLTKEPVTAAELQRAKERLTNSYAVLRLARPDFAKDVACHELYGGNVDLAWQAEDVIAATTAADLMAVAKQYFQYHAVGVLMPGDDVEALD